VDDRADARKVRDVAADQQRDRQDVVSKHLPVVASALLGVDHIDLVEPPS
jgi:hypothetical protein